MSDDGFSGAFLNRNAVYTGRAMPCLLKTKREWVGGMFAASSEAVLSCNTVVGGLVGWGGLASRGSSSWINATAAL